MQVPSAVRQWLAYQCKYWGCASCSISEYWCYSLHPPKACHPVWLHWNIIYINLQWNILLWLYNYNLIALTYLLWINVMHDLVWLCIVVCFVGQLMADKECHTKRCLELQNNAVGHTTFVDTSDMLAGLTTVFIHMLICLVFYNVSWSCPSYFTFMSGWNVPS